MKKIILALLSVCLLIACEQNGSETNASKEGKPDSVVYVYPIKNPDGWNIATDSKNTMAAQNVIKAYEVNDFEKARPYLADTVAIYADDYHYKGVKDSAIQQMIAERVTKKDASVRMRDWESVVAKDGKESYVTSWYILKWLDDNNQWDSAAIVNDMRLKNGVVDQIYIYKRTFTAEGK